jgi:hypothetical protein
MKVMLVCIYKGMFLHSLLFLTLLRRVLGTLIRRI